MIKIRIKNADHEIDVRFPIRENELYAKLAEIHAIEEKDAPQSAFVTEVYWPEEFSMLKDRFANLDELNYLAKRMESFDYGEHFEQQPIDTEDDDLYVSFWNSGDNYSIMTHDELDAYIDNQGMTMGGM